LRHFTDLIEKLSNVKNEIQIIHALKHFFKGNIPETEQTEALKLLLNVYPKRIITAKKLKSQIECIIGFPLWLIERCEKETGGFISALGLLMRSKLDTKSLPLSVWISEINALSFGNQRNIYALINKISTNPPEERLLLLRLITGTFKSPVSKILIINALAEHLQISVEIASLRLFDLESKGHLRYLDLNNSILDESQKIPVSFPHIIPYQENDLVESENPKVWSVFGKKEGIMVQLVKYRKNVYLWSSEGIILNNKFPEIIRSVELTGGNFKIHGQIIPKKEETPIEVLFKRLDKKNVSNKELSETPANFEIWRASDNEYNFIEILSKSGFTLIEKIGLNNWRNLDLIHKDCRKLGYTGLLIQMKNQSDYYYRKASEFSIRALLTYVELDSIDKYGIKSLNFGLLDKNDEIIPIAKTEKFDDQVDLLEIIDYTKQNTIERFGPVRTVKPELIYELHFDGISEAKRRKSGVALSNVIVFKKILPSHIEPDKLEEITSILN